MNLKDLIKRIFKDKKENSSDSNKEIKLKIEDFLYFNFDKALSIFSQFEWGSTEKYTFHQEKSSTSKVGGQLGNPNIAKIQSDLNYSSGSFEEATKRIHYDLFNRVYSYLNDHRLLKDLDGIHDDQVNSVNEIKKIIDPYSYVKLSGKAIIADYQRLIDQGKDFSKYYETFIEIRKNSKEVADLKEKLGQEKKELKTIKDASQRAIKERLIQEISQSLDKKIDFLDETTKKNIGDVANFLDFSLRNRLVVEITPFEKFPNFSVTAVLKRSLLSDDELDHLLYAYGFLPNVSLSAMGLIVSNPSKIGNELTNNESISEVDQTDVIKNVELNKIENSLRNLVEAFAGMENLFRFDQYPKVMIDPIAIYREITYR